MSNTVASLSIVFMGISCAIAFLLPVGLLIYYRKKKGADILPFFIGCAVMLLFALILEAAVHRVVLSSPAGAVIQNNLWLYALYGGFMAGLFEESGRFLAFKTVLKKYRDKDANALMYGAGHGGFEAAVLLGMTMINNIAISLMINSGNAGVMTGALSGDALTQVEEAIKALGATPSYYFLMGVVERIFAVILQIALSVLVWFAAKKSGKLLLYPFAILIHFAVDAVTVILSGLGMNTLLLEAAVGVMALLAALYSRRVWKKLSTE